MTMLHILCTLCSVRNLLCTLYCIIMLSCTPAQVDTTAQVSRLVNDLSVHSNLLDKKLEDVSKRAEEISKIAGDKSLSWQDWLYIFGLGTAGLVGQHKLRNKTSETRVKKVLQKFSIPLKE